MEILHLDEIPLETAVQKAAAVLSSGGIVLYPTDTLYGLGVDARNPDAISKLQELKGREANKPISVVVPSLELLETYAQMDEVSRALAQKHLPGALTLVLPAKDSVSPSVTASGMLGLRIPDYPFTNALSHEFAAPYTATSANLSGQPSLATVDEILAQLGPQAAQIDLVIDAGPRAGAIPSTVVAATEGRVQVLREGAIARGAL